MAATAQGFDFRHYEEVKKTFSSAGTEGNRMYIRPEYPADYVDLLIVDIKRTERSADRGEDEPALSDETVRTVETLVSCIRRIDLPTPEVSSYYGELDVTWRRSGKLVRLIAYPDSRNPRVYFHVDSEPVGTRGHSIEATDKSLIEKLDWLNN